MDLTDNKKIVINSAILYSKLIISTFIGLYSSRLVLQALGVSDYGLYNVIGGVVIMMNFLGATMSSVTNRYIIVELGKGEEGNCQKIFNTTLTIHILIAILIIFAGETIGTYYVDNIANIDNHKITDANFILQMSLIACGINIIGTPFNGLIIAKENFLYPAVIEILRSIIKLVLIYTLLYYIGNKLRLYAVLMAGIESSLPICIMIYCYIRERAIICWNFNTNIKDYISIVKYTFWMLIGAIASIGQVQISNIIINIYFGTIANAAYSIANQISSYLMTFVRSFNQAVQPQIMKKFNTKHSNNLIYISTRFSFLFLLLPCFPILLNLDFILKIWLNEVPQFTHTFCTYLIIINLIKVLSSGFDTSIQASGRIMINQLVFSILYLAIMPISYYLYKIGYPINTINILILIATILFTIFQLLYICSFTELSIKYYFLSTIIPITKVCLSLLPVVYLQQYIPSNNKGLIYSIIISELWVCLSIYILALTKNEKLVIAIFLHNLKRKFTWKKRND